MSIILILFIDGLDGLEALENEMLFPERSAHGQPRSDVVSKINDNDQ